jgi:hypothetical protein
MEHLACLEFGYRRRNCSEDRIEACFRSGLHGQFHMRFHVRFAHKIASECDFVCDFMCDFVSAVASTVRTWNRTRKPPPRFACMRCIWRGRHVSAHYFMDLICVTLFCSCQGQSRSLVLLLPCPFMIDIFRFLWQIGCSLDGNKAMLTLSLTSDYQKPLPSQCRFVIHC